MEWRVLVLSDYDSRIKWGISLARKLTKSNKIDIVIRESQHEIVGCHLGNLGDISYADNPLLYLRDVEISSYDILIIALGGTLNLKATNILNIKCKPNTPRPLLIGGINGLTNSNDLRVILYRMGLDLVVLNCWRDKYNFKRLSNKHGISLPRMVVSGYLREYPGLSNTNENSNLIAFMQQDGIPFKRDEFRKLVKVLVEFASSNPSKTIAVKMRDVNKTGLNNLRASYSALEVCEGVLNENKQVKNLYVDFRGYEEVLLESSEVWSISSTSLIEALILGKRAYCLSNFGVNKHNGNLPFKNSGIMIDMHKLNSRAMFNPHKEWLRWNVMNRLSKEELKKMVHSEIEHMITKNWELRQIKSLSDINYISQSFWCSLIDIMKGIVSCTKSSFV